ncbi:MAG: hypothetical protein U5K37_12130 [Natrialbaceae archaeon]|nr:hypothetical protein [Natrialbaceae archaeon]
MTLAYNRVLTGSALRFPYQVFAPEDGPGFGHREILAHSMEYTPELALEANTWALRFLATRWVALGLVGVGFAAVGVILAFCR